MPIVPPNDSDPNGPLGRRQRTLASLRAKARQSQRIKVDANGNVIEILPDPNPPAAA